MTDFYDDHIDAIGRLSRMSQLFPNLAQAEKDARLVLAQAIIEWDRVERRIETGERLHSMNEQQLVEQARENHAQALADLLRGEEPEGQETPANANRRAEIARALADA